MKIFTGTLYLTIAVFLPNYVESRPSEDFAGGEFPRALTASPEEWILSQPLSITHLRDWEGHYYGIRVRNSNSMLEMIFPLGTYEYEPGRRLRKFKFWLVQPRAGDVIFRRGIHSATVHEHGIYQTDQNGALVKVDRHPVTFHPESADILSEDGVHRLAVYEEGFRLYLVTYRNLVHPPDGQI